MFFESSETRKYPKGIFHECQTFQENIAEEIF